MNYVRTPPLTVHISRSVFPPFQSLLLSLDTPDVGGFPGSPPRPVPRGQALKAASIPGAALRQRLHTGRFMLPRVLSQAAGREQVADRPRGAGTPGSNLPAETPLLCALGLGPQFPQKE